MRLFGVSNDGDFAEYVKAGFGDEHQEAMLEDWLENNPDGIVGDSWRRPTETVPLRPTESVPP
jgi:hypothetical protein